MKLHDDPYRILREPQSIEAHRVQNERETAAETRGDSLEQLIERKLKESCAKCGRAFTSPSEYRWAAGRHGYICRNERACRAAGGER